MYLCLRNYKIYYESANIGTFNVIIVTVVESLALEKAMNFKIVKSSEGGGGWGGGKIV